MDSLLLILDNLSYYDTLDMIKDLSEDNLLNKKTKEFVNLNTDGLELIQTSYKFCKYETDDILYISFPGRMYFKEYIIYGILLYGEIDLNNKDDEEKYYIHSGILRRYNEIKLCLEKVTKVSTKKIIFSGHSFGGCIASIAALQCKLQNPNNVVECYTYGSPSYCDYNTKILIDNTLDKYKRCYHINDPVVNYYFNYRFYAGGKEDIIKTNLNFSSNLKYHRLYVYFKLLYR
jgi:hypothetical protein